MGGGARVAAVLAIGFGAGFAGGHVTERAGTEPVTAPVAGSATASGAFPFATSMPPTETRVASVDDLADVGLTDRDGRRFTLADGAGAVTVLAFAPAPCDAACAAGVDDLLEVRRRLSGARAGDGNADAAATARAPVEFVLVSDAAAPPPEAAIVAEAVPPGEAADAQAATDARGTRWRVGRADARDVAALGGRLGLAPDAARAGRAAVLAFDATGALVQRYRADPLDVARLADEIAHLRDRAR